MTEIKQFRLFWAWEDEKEENWLREMSQAGWHFSNVSLPGYYTFVQGEPKDYVYRLDYLADSKDFANYLQIFRDAGWDYMGKMSNWQYFRKEAVNGESPDIYSDNDSKVKKYQRILTILVIFLPIFMISMINVSKAPEGFYQALAFVSFLFILLYIYAILQLIRRVSELKKKL